LYSWALLYDLQIKVNLGVRFVFTVNNAWEINPTNAVTLLMRPPY